MAFNDIANRTDLAATISTEVEQQIFQDITEGSAVLSLANRQRNMTKQERELRILDSLVTASFTTAGTAAESDQAMIPTSDVSYRNLSLLATKLGVVVPIPKDVFNDSDYDMWAQIRPLIVQAFAKAIDAAILFGTGAPSDWQTDLFAGTSAATPSGTVTLTSDLYVDLFEDAGVYAKLEALGFNPNGHIAALAMKSKYRGTKTTDGLPIFTPGVGETPDMIGGAPVLYPTFDLIDGTTTTNMWQITGDWNRLLYSFREGIEFDVSDQGMITDGSLVNQFNLWQQDLVAIKATARIGVQVVAPTNNLADGADRYPFVKLWTPA